MNTLLRLCGGYFDMMENRCDNGGEIPKNEIICFRKSTEAFLKSGKKADAFVVYFCFSEIFKLFGSGYENTQKLLETLSDHEYHSGELLSGLPPSTGWRSSGALLPKGITLTKAKPAS